MSGSKHHYELSLEWTGNTGEGTSGYRSYSRNHILRAKGKPDLVGSSDPTFRGDRSRYNPEELLVASLSSCHMLWFLHLCAEAKLIVEDYSDEASGSMAMDTDGGGHFEEVTLRPAVRFSGSPDSAQVDALHHRAHELCFIARSVNFPVKHEARMIIN